MSVDLNFLPRNVKGSMGEYDVEFSMSTKNLRRTSSFVVKLWRKNFERDIDK